jgi:hypothetical protein
MPSKALSAPSPEMGLLLPSKSTAVISVGLGRAVGVDGGIVVGDRAHHRSGSPDRVARALRGGPGEEGSERGKGGQIHSRPGFSHVTLQPEDHQAQRMRRRGTQLGPAMPRPIQGPFSPKDSAGEPKNLTCNTPAANIDDEGNVAAIKRSHQCGCPFLQFEVALICVDRNDAIELNRLPVFSQEGFLRNYQ